MRLTDFVVREKHRWGSKHKFFSEKITNTKILKEKKSFLAAVKSHVSGIQNVDGQQSTISRFGHKSEVPRKTGINQGVVSG